MHIMPKGLRNKFIFFFLLILLAVFFTLPSFNKNLPSWWKKYLGSEGFKLGLDLQGGMHLILRVDVEQAINNTLAFSARDLKEVLQKREITAIQLQSNNPHQVNFFPA